MSLSNHFSLDRLDEPGGRPQTLGLVSLASRPGIQNLVTNGSMSGLLNLQYVLSGGMVGQTSNTTSVTRALVPIVKKDIVSVNTLGQPFACIARLSPINSDNVLTCHINPTSVEALPDEYVTGDSRGNGPAYSLVNIGKIPLAQITQSSYDVAGNFSAIATQCMFLKTAATRTGAGSNDIEGMHASAVLTTLPGPNELTRAGVSGLASGPHHYSASKVSFDKQSVGIGASHLNFISGNSVDAPGSSFVRTTFRDLAVTPYLIDGVYFLHHAGDPSDGFGGIPSYYDSPFFLGLQVRVSTGEAGSEAIIRGTISADFVNADPVSGESVVTTVVTTVYGSEVARNGFYPFSHIDTRIRFPNPTNTGSPSGYGSYLIGVTVKLEYLDQNSGVPQAITGGSITSTIEYMSRTPDGESTGIVHIVDDGYNGPVDVELTTTFLALPNRDRARDYRLSVMMPASPEAMYAIKLATLVLFGTAQGMTFDSNAVYNDWLMLVADPQKLMTYVTHAMTGGDSSEGNWVAGKDAGLTPLLQAAEYSSTGRYNPKYHASFFDFIGKGLRTIGNIAGAVQDVACSDTAKGLVNQFSSSGSRDRRSFLAAMVGPGRYTASAPEKEADYLELFGSDRASRAPRIHKVGEPANARARTCVTTPLEEKARSRALLTQEEKIDAKTGFPHVTTGSTTRRKFVSLASLERSERPRYNACEGCSCQKATHHTDGCACSCGKKLLSSATGYRPVSISSDPSARSRILQATDEAYKHHTAGDPDKARSVLLAAGVVVPRGGFRASGKVNLDKMLRDLTLGGFGTPEVVGEPSSAGWRETDEQDEEFVDPENDGDEGDEEYDEVENEVAPISQYELNESQVSTIPRAPPIKFDTEAERKEYITALVKDGSISHVCYTGAGPYLSGNYTKRVLDSSIKGGTFRDSSARFVAPDAVNETVVFPLLCSTGLPISRTNYNQYNMEGGGILNVHEVLGETAIRNVVGIFELVKRLQGLSIPSGEWYVTIDAGSVVLGPGAIDGPSIGLACVMAFKGFPLGPVLTGAVDTETGKLGPIGEAPRKVLSYRRLIETDDKASFVGPLFIPSSSLHQNDLADNGIDTLGRSRTNSLFGVCNLESKTVPVENVADVCLWYTSCYGRWVMSSADRQAEAKRMDFFTSIKPFAFSLDRNLALFADQRGIIEDKNSSSDEKKQALEKATTYLNEAKAYQSRIFDVNPETFSDQVMMKMPKEGKSSDNAERAIHLRDVSQAWKNASKAANAKFVAISEGKASMVNKSGQHMPMITLDKSLSKAAAKLKQVTEFRRLKYDGSFEMFDFGMQMVNGSQKRVRKVVFNPKIVTIARASRRSRSKSRTRTPGSGLSSNMWTALSKQIS